MVATIVEVMRILRGPLTSGCVQQKNGAIQEPMDCSTRILESEKMLRTITHKPQGDFAELLVSGRKIAPELRLKIDALTRLAGRIDALKKKESELAGPTLRERQAQLNTAVQQQAAKLVVIQKEVAVVEALLREQQEKDLLSSSWAQLHEHGSRLGLQDGHCPLCGSDITEAKYRNHLSELAIAIRKTAETTTDLVRRRATLGDSEKRANAELSAARRESDQLSMALEFYWCSGWTMTMRLP